jgi:hypothetical protein
LSAGSSELVAAVVLGSKQAVVVLGPMEQALVAGLSLGMVLVRALMLPAAGSLREPEQANPPREHSMQAQEVRMPVRSHHQHCSTC